MRPRMVGKLRQEAVTGMGEVWRSREQGAVRGGGSRGLGVSESSGSCEGPEPCHMTGQLSSRRPAIPLCPQLTVKELRDELTALNLDTRGNKAMLVRRWRP